MQFVIAGVQKGGTSVLDAYLREHPQIRMAREKELHFFDAKDFPTRRPPDYKAYHAAFDFSGEFRVAGEATPSYLYWFEAPRRIWSYNPAMRLIVVLRDPVARAYSHWNMQRERGIDPLPFEEAIREEEKRCREALPHQSRLYSYVDRGYYADQIRRLWHFFPREQTLFLRNETLRGDPAACLAQVARFLGVDPFPPVEAREVHARAYESGIPAAARELLRETYRQQIRQLERMLDWDLASWLQ